MAHEIESMMYVGETPWHGLGKFVGAQNVDSKTAIVQAGLDWEVEAHPMFAANPLTGKPVDCEHQAVFRMSDGRKLGEVGSKFEPVQNAQAFDFMDVLAADGEMRYHTAGSLKHGRKVWILAQLPGELRVGRGDRTHPFALLTNAHDGSGALRVLPTSVRVVCANTLHMALSRKKKHEGVSIRHTGDVMARIGAAREALGLVREEFDIFARFSQELANVRMHRDDFAAIAYALIPDAPAEATDKVKSNAVEKRDTLVNLFENGRGQRLDGVAGTAWAGLNAITEFTSYFRGGKRVSADSRLDSVWFGDGDRFNQTGVQLLDRMYSLDFTSEAPAQQHVHVAA